MILRLSSFLKIRVHFHKEIDDSLLFNIGQGLWTKLGRIFQRFSSPQDDDILLKETNNMARVLNVAEKNDAAKNLAEILSNGHLQRRNGLSIFNKIYEFDYQLGQDKCNMVMTSVSGHLLNIEFTGQFKNWRSCNPVALFEAPIVNACPEDYQNIKRTLEQEAKRCSKLIIWTDGDREGENIGFEIIGVCTNVNPRLTVLRARFSEITRPAITRAIQNLQAPDKRTSDAVEVRKELDLRIGAAFTRFQTLRLKKVFPEVLGDGPVISYGSCQFPTMGFVIERYKEAQNFIPQPFWKIEVKHKRNDIVTNFSWKRNRVFDRVLAVAFCIPCWENREATVKDVQHKSKSKWRPLPLDTVELEKNGSRKLRINAKETMKIAESLYTRGFISYPRTETNMFPKEMDLAGLVQMQTVDANWGDFAQRVLQVGPNPRQGTKTDNAHPPIHPTKYTNTLGGDEKKIYDFVVRHFLACVSQDAKGFETSVEIGIATELFIVKGLLILEKNYLEVYPYEKWTDKELPEYQLGEVFVPDSIEIEEGCTTAPQLLTEADLIALMEKHGIGTDATHAEHIEKIKERLYVGLNAENRFVPGELGIGLADGYDSMGVFMSKPNYRSELEADLKRICEGTRNPEDVLKEQIKKYKDIFVQAVAQATKIDSELAKYFGNATDLQEEVLEPVTQPVMKCPRCKVSEIFLKEKKNGKGFVLTCMGYPACDATIWLPDTVELAVVSDENCQECRNGPVRKIKFKHRMYNITEEHTACFGGCNMRWFDELGIRPFQTGGTASNNRNIIRPLRDLEVPDIPGPRRVVRTRGAAAPRNRGNASLRNNRRMDEFFNGGNDSAVGTDVVCCSCGIPSKMLTVKKVSANQGRKFYACSKPQNEQCGFFKWADET